MSASHSVQLLETKPSPLLVLGWATVCQQTLSRATLFHCSLDNSKHFFFSTVLPLHFVLVFFVVVLVIDTNDTWSRDDIYNYILL